MTEKEKMLAGMVFRQIFKAFTSLSYSDMAQVKPTDIDGDTLYITTQKTKAEAMKLIENAWGI